MSSGGLDGCHLSAIFSRRLRTTSFRTSRTFRDRCQGRLDVSLACRGPREQQGPCASGTVPARTFTCWVASGKPLLFSVPLLYPERIRLDDLRGTVWDAQMPPVLLFS